MATRKVWNHNLVEELAILDQALLRCRAVSIDTEFPGFIQETPRKADEDLLYGDLKYNVDATRLIQLGLTLSDNEGCVLATWEFNVNFDLETDLYTEDSVLFLIKSGIEFPALKKYGIDPTDLSDGFAHILSRHRNLTWVTFHGLYDMAYFLKLVTRGAPLPSSASKFTALVGKVFGRVCDLKFIAKFCNGLNGGELSLAKAARILKVDRLGGAAHHAGSDSLLTAAVYAKLKSVYEIDELEYMGFLYSLKSRIWISNRYFDQTPMVMPYSCGSPDLLASLPPILFWDELTHQFSH